MKLSNFFALYNPKLTPSTGQLIAKIVFEVMSALQTLALLNAEEALTIMTEMKKVLLEYLEPYLTVPGF